MPKNQLVGQKFKIGDVVYKKNVFGSSKKLEHRTGTIYGVKTKKNSRGSSYFYYNIQWNDRTRTENAQHSIEFIKNI